MLNNEEGVSGSLNRISLPQLGWPRVPDVPAEEEEAPTYLNTTTNCPFLVISTDKLSAQYNGEARHGYDVGAIQGNCPAPVRKLLYYFEIYVKDKGQRGTVSIGFTDEHFKMTRQPGWDANSFGYHGDDGFLYHGNGKGEPFGSKFTTGDTVGAGINYASQTIFFTKNGKFVGSTPKDVKGSLFPTIGLHSQNEKVDVNFGQRAFVFDIEDYFSRQLFSATTFFCWQAQEMIALFWETQSSSCACFLLSRLYKSLKMESYCLKMQVHFAFFGGILFSSTVPGWCEL